MKNKVFYLLIIIVTVLFTSCYKERTYEGGEDLSDWTASTHGSTATPNYSKVFNDDEVLRLDIVIDPTYWDIMLEDLDSRFSMNDGGNMPPPPGTRNAEAEAPDDIGDDGDNPIYVPCSVFHDGLEWYYVGIRFKGNSSLRDPVQQGLMKFPFRLEFNHFSDEYPQVTGQTFYGFQQLSLGNNFRDMSLVREKVASDLFRDFGVNAAHATFCRLYVDYGEGPVYFGLYTLVEIVFDTMLKDQFGSENGNCYKPENQGASFSLGSFNTIDFDKKTNEGLADWSDVESLYTTLHNDKRISSPIEWRTNLESILDVDYFLKWLAANTAMQNWDTYGNMTHNYYLYNDPNDNLIKWIPWDNNEALLEDGGVNGALPLDFSGVNAEWPLIRYIFDQPEYQQIYKDYLVEFVNTSFLPSRMHGIYDHHYDLIKEYVIGNDGEIEGYTFVNSDSDFENAFNQLHSHVEGRKTAVEDYVY